MIDFILSAQKSIAIIGKNNSRQSTFYHVLVMTTCCVKGVYYLEQSFPGQRLYTPTNSHQAWM